MGSRKRRLQFRNLVMEEQDRVFDEWDGETPSHILVSSEVWSFLKDNARFEKLRDNPMNIPGFLGMRVWKCSALDSKPQSALMLSDDVFWEIAPRSKDFYSGSP